MKFSMWFVVDYWIMVIYGLLHCEIEFRLICIGTIVILEIFYPAGMHYIKKSHKSTHAHKQYVS